MKRALLKFVAECNSPGYRLKAFVTLTHLERSPAITGLAMGYYHELARRTLEDIVDIGGLQKNTEQLKQLFARSQELVDLKTACPKDKLQVEVGVVAARAEVLQ